MAIVVFNQQLFLATYPEFSAVTATRLQIFFTQAGIYLRNTDCSPVQDLNIRTMILNMITAHLAQLSGVLNASGTPDGLVGRISSATEGSVEVTTQMSGANPNSDWWAQTSYGLSAFQALASYRGGRYFPGQRRFSGIGYYPGVPCGY